MIDAKYQGKGFGRKAFKLALESISNKLNPRKIHISFNKGNVAANDLYSSFGFVDNGIDEYGQINLVLKTQQGNEFRA